MKTHDIFLSPSKSSPKIYAYILPSVPDHEGYIKIGYTTRDPEIRIAQQTQTAGIPHKTLLTVSAFRNDGTVFRDTDVHAVLEHNGFSRMNESREWFKCSIDDVRSAIEAVRERRFTLSARIEDFQMRPEQSHAVRMTEEYFRNSGHTRKFLWNAKMRFGKTFAAYQLCKRMNFMNILIVTYKPVVESSWSKDILTHKDFEGWQFISVNTAGVKGMRIDDEFMYRDEKYPVVVFGSFQDFLGRNANGGIKAKNEFLHTTHWDIVIIDEYHFGAWRDNARNLFRCDDEYDVDADYETMTGNDDFLPVTAEYRLYLSGTPFRALNSGEFIEEQIYSWTYTDEQRAKEKWRGAHNPYESMPGMVMMVYKIPGSIRRMEMLGEYDDFDLNVFFSADDSGFLHEEYVRKWLQMIRGAYLPFETENLRREHRPPMPYSDSYLLKHLKHTVWFLPDVASCRAMKKLLEEDMFFHDYGIILCAGDSCGDGLAAFDYLMKNIQSPDEARTITLTCGKLLTGVTVPYWSAIFMLRNLKSPETYFQAAFRVQSSWTAEDEYGCEEIMKRECFIFDFAIERALKQAADYSCRLNLHEDDPEKKAEEFMRFLPVFAFDGGSMKQLNASDVLDFAVSGTSASMLARRWQSALLVNVNSETLSRILNDSSALNAIEKITSYRALNKEIETIINKTESIRKKKNGEETSTRKEITKEEKELRKKIQEIQEKLMKFLSRVPVFMYLTDEREKTLMDIIQEMSPNLFMRVTGIEIQDFRRLNELGLFNSELMNEAIYNFKRYEDSSLDYTGIEVNEVSKFGGFNETIEIYEER